MHSQNFAQTAVFGNSFKVFVISGILSKPFFGRVEKRMASAFIRVAASAVGDESGKRFPKI
jgi:hypothetical protein